MKFSRGLKFIVLSTLGLLYLSGAVTWVMSNWFLHDEGFGPQVSPFRVWWLEIHSIIGLFFMVVFGYLLHSHVRPSWMRQRRVPSGVTLTAGIILLMVSVPFLFYLANEEWKAWVGWAHTYFGLVMAAPFIWHYFFKRD